MKQKLTVTVESDLIPVAKRYARSKGVSLSALIEQSLREATDQDKLPFGTRWRGKFQPAERTGDPLYEALAKKYLQ